MRNRKLIPTMEQPRGSSRYMRVISRRCALPGYPFIHACMHRALTRSFAPMHERRFEITDAVSGLRIGGAYMRRSAISDALYRLQAFRISHVRAAVSFAARASVQGWRQRWDMKTTLRNEPRLRFR